MMRYGTLGRRPLAVVTRKHARKMRKVASRSFFGPHSPGGEEARQSRQLFTAVVGVGSLGWISLGCSEDSFTASDRALEQSARESSVSLLEAAVVASDEGEVVDIELEPQGDRYLYEADVYKDGVWKEIVIDPESGRIIGRDDTSGAFGPAPAGSITIAEAISIAQERQSGAAVDASLEADGYYEVLFIDGGTRFEVDVSLSGRVLEVDRDVASELDDDDDDENDENDEN